MQIAYSALLEKLENSHQQSKSFVVFAAPNQNKITAIFPFSTPKKTTLKETTTGFVFAPFELSKGVYVFTNEESTFFEATMENSAINTNQVTFEEDTSALKGYESLIENTIQKIKTSEIKKIVLSRCASTSLNNFSLKVLQQRLFGLYKDAYRYIWYHPEGGLWCGASPELLLEVDGMVVKTIALAGTKKNTSKSQWSAKELEEQQLVTDAIKNVLQNITTALTVSKPKSSKAGSLHHLKTVIGGVLNKGNHTAFSIASKLHPTPAVCGTPKVKAREYILANEGYDREFYTGFFGLVTNNGKKGNLYVNLRCMKIHNNVAHLFTGGGITLSSAPQSERIETQNKQHTMLQVLAPFL